MNPIQVACCALLASAFVLAGTLIVSLDARWDSEAQASLVIARDNFTVMTAKTRENEEAFFVLDDANARLLIYRLDIARKQLSPSGAFNLQELFKANGGK